MILVTGGTGGIGSILVDQLRAAGLPLRLLVREGEAERVRGKALEAVVGDMGDRSSLDRAMRGVEMLLLSSGASAELPRLQGAVVDAAAAGGVRKIVKLSSRGADPNAEVELLRYHGEVEARIEETGLSYVFLRPTFMFQNFGRQIDQILATHVIQAPIGTARIAMFDARDLGDVAAAALSSSDFDGAGHYLTGPQALTHAEVASAIGQIANSDIRFQNVSPQDFASDLQRQGAKPDYIRITLGLYEDWKAGNADAANSNFIRMTGRAPRSLHAYLTDPFASRAQGA